MRENSKERFSAVADLYHRFRPGYPDALFDWILAQAPRGTIADIGCGTGISTRLLAARGRETIGLDPNEEMLAVARREGGRYAKGEASATGLPDHSVTLITAAQAFHWFNTPETLREWRRILKPEGWCCAFWNLRETGPFMDAYDRLLLTTSDEYRAVKERWTDDPCEPVSNREERSFPYVQRMDRAALIGRAFSSSYVEHGVRDKDGLRRALEALFDRFQIGGGVDFVYRTRAIAWQFVGSGGHGVSGVHGAN